MTIINASISMDAIDQAKLATANNGKKYLNLSIIVSDTKDQYDYDVQISHSQSKEEREAKAPKTYIGRGKVVFVK